MSEGRSLKGISNTIFVLGILAAVVTSSFVSTFVAAQWMRGPRGPQGEQGPQGPPGVSKIPLAYKMIDLSISLDHSTYPEWVDLADWNGPMSVQITTENKSNLLIVFYAYLRGEWASSTIGWARIDIRALVDDALAWPSDRMFFNGVQGLETPSWNYGANVSSHAPYCGVFNAPVSAGLHNVKIQWSVLGLTSATVLQSYLIVYALPDA